MPLLMAGLFMLCLTAATLSGKLPMLVLGLYVVASLVAFGAYARDKSAAQKSQRRTPENTLHLLGLIGGWPGALVAQQLLRHKTSKLSFQFVFWTTALLNGGMLFWLRKPGNATVLHSLLGLPT